MIETDLDEMPGKRCVDLNDIGLKEEGNPEDNRKGDHVKEVDTREDNPTNNAKEDNPTNDAKEDNLKVDNAKGDVKEDNLKDEKDDRKDDLKVDVKQVVVVPDSNPNGDELANSIDELANSNAELKATNPNDSVENLKELNAHCKQLGLCLRCQLRFLGELYSSAVFVGSETDLKDKINELLKVKQDQPIESSAKRFKHGTFCYCCIGLLENGCENDELNKILDIVSNFEYKFKDFQINLFLPVPLMVREHVIQAKLFNRFRHLEKHIKNCYSVKDVYKYVLVRKISKLTNSTFNINSKTEITVETKYGNTQIECLELYSKCKNQFNLKTNLKFDAIFTQTAVSKALQQMGVRGLIGLRLERPDRCMNMENVSLMNHSLFVVGRYNKYSRQLSQTPWLIDGKQMRDSLEDLITKAIRKHISCEKTRFSASGREDVDVCMLGRGRPFSIELVNPVRLDIDQSVFAEIRNDVKRSSNNEIDLKDLQFGDKENVSKNLKHGEVEKKKIYKALCVSSRPIEQKDVDKINQIKDLTIQQDTPLRVLHRRTLATRPKIIHDLKIELIENETHKFNLIVTTEAGTYVKEFVNSDFNRTHPSLGTILEDCETDILELDVLEVCYDWPPYIEDQVDTSGH